MTISDLFPYAGCAWTVWMLTSSSCKSHRAMFGMTCWYELIWFDMTWYVCKLRSYFIKVVNLRIELSLKPCGSEKVSLLNCTRVATILWMAPGHDRAILLQGSKSGITGIDLFHIKKLPLAQAASGSQKSSCNKATVPYLSSASCLLKGWKDFACWPWVSSSGGPIKILSSNM